MTDTIALLLAISSIMTALVAAGVAVYTTLQATRKQVGEQPQRKADMANTLMDASNELIAQLKSRIVELEKKLDLVGQRIDALVVINKDLLHGRNIWQSRAELLRYQLARLGTVPCVDWENGVMALENKEQKGGEVSVD